MNIVQNRPLALAGLALALGIVAVFFLFQGKESDNQTASRTSVASEQPIFQRIICAAPSITEMVFSLGKGSHVVGVSDFSFYPPKAAEVARIGGLINPNRERILSLQPDLIIFQGRHQLLSQFSREQGIRSVSLAIDRLSDITASIKKLGAELGASSQAARLAESIQAELDELAKQTQSRTPRKVFLGLGHTPGDLTGLMTTGPDTFLHELIEIAGGINIFSDATGSYPRISKEALVRRRPHVIIEVLAEGISPDNRKLLRADWERMASLPAVKAGRIHFLDEDYMLIPGVRVAQTARRLAQAIHPEIFEGKHD
jgi:iron complex transport system substrate-binding protein